MPPYDRDAQWQSFYEHGDLSRELLSDQDIEAYDWDNQAIILTQEASRRIHSDLRNFIIVLDGKRLYGGKGINRISQMAIRYPVIYTIAIEDRTVLLIRPTHDFGRRPQLEKEEWQALTPKELKQHFTANGKLRHPWANDSFKDLQKNVHRIRALTATAKQSALHAEYDIEGNRTGDYAIREKLSWKVGNESCSLGPSFDTTLRLKPGSVHRQFDFPFADIAKKYQYNHTANLQDNKSRPISWEITVTISPLFSKGETSIDLVEKINLSLVRGYGADLFTQLAQHSGSQWSSLEDMKIANLPMNWAAIEKSR